MRKVTLTSTIVILFASALAVGCGSAQVTAIRSYDGSPVPHPRTIYVYDFAVRSDEVMQSTGTRVEAYLAGERATSEELDEVRKVAHALSEVLVEEFQNSGMPAVRREGELEIAAGSLGVYGQLVSIDEGSRWKRVLIGFGVGKSTLSAIAQLYRPTPGGPAVMTEFQGTAESGWKPGILTTLPIGAAVQGIAVAAAVSAGSGVLGEINSSVAADARRFAKKLAKELEEFFEEQGWSD